MSRNSKAKRDAKAKVRSKQQRTSQAHSGHFDTSATARPLDPAAPGQLFRSACNECGSKDLAWMTTGELVDRLPAHKRAPAEEGVDFFGPNTQAWLCGNCSSFGIMST